MAVLHLRLGMGGGGAAMVAFVWRWINNFVISYRFLFFVIFVFVFGLLHDFYCNIGPAKIWLILFKFVLFS
jgi:hypothetical protein